MLDVESLLPVLRTLVDPTKIVLTSRHRLLGESDIYLYPVPELSERNALALLRQAGSRHNVAGLAATGDDDLRPPTPPWGGNPLALLLLVGPLHLHDLHTLLRAPARRTWKASREPLHLHLLAPGNPSTPARQVLLGYVAGQGAGRPSRLYRRHQRPRQH